MAALFVFRSKWHEEYLASELNEAVMLRTFFLLASLAFMLPASAQDNAAPGVQRLHAAASRGDARVMATLLDHGVPVDGRNNNGETALLLAVQAGHTLIADMLVARGADINAQAANKDTPWLLAGADGRTAMLEFMLPRGPDYALRNRYGGSALIPACHHGHVDAVRFLTAHSKIDIDQVNNLGWTCLLETVILGDGGGAYREITRIVLAAGANPNLADKEGVTPLQHAQRRGHTDMARILAAAGGR